MKEQEFYKKLVDLYAGEELAQELKDELELAAFQDPDLSHDMQTLSATVRTLRNSPRPEFTEESFHRILMKMQTRGLEVEVKAPTPAHLQLRLPMNG